MRNMGKEGFVIEISKGKKKGKFRVVERVLKRRKKIRGNGEVLGHRLR